MREQRKSPQGIQSTLANALDRHFVVCAAVATAAVVAGQAEHAQAAIIYSGLQNVPLLQGGGLYINLVTDNSTGVPTGWDINPYVRGSDHFFNMYLPPAAGGGTQVMKSLSPTAGGGDIGELAAGTTIGPTSTFIGQPSQFGFFNNATVGDWVGTGTGYMGVEFKEASVNGGNPVFGWVQISKTVAGLPTGNPTGITFIDWAYDDSGAAIVAGVPEPSSLALLAAGAVGLCVRRGKAKLRRSETATA